MSYVKFSILFYKPKLNSIVMSDHTLSSSANTTLQYSQSGDGLNISTHCLTADKLTFYCQRMVSNFVELAVFVTTQTTTKSNEHLDV